jgi:hypothetical protein
MLYMGWEDKPMLDHVNEIIGDRLSGGDTYNAASVATADKLTRLTPPALLLTGDEMTEAEAHALLRRVVNAELDQWVPGASQRLIYRASRALGFSAAEPRRTDCGDKVASHATVTQWVAGLYLRQCVGCARLFRV